MCFYITSESPLCLFFLKFSILVLFSVAGEALGVLVYAHFIGWIRRGDAEFVRLKVLKLQGVRAKGMGRILTLEVIEIMGCSISTNPSALKIKEEQESEGNFFLNIHILVVHTNCLLNCHPDSFMLSSC
ncbi:unnamed protein product [Lactuca saligna]|uniref:Uncharacterized protein n=1 Tax=Lactuca saligna TaxID=75948 RepID=A0AA35ZYK8_LACSI|nr:unnamed protein product [Lactuca saligna]